MLPANSLAWLHGVTFDLYNALHLEKCTKYVVISASMFDVLDEIICSVMFNQQNNTSKKFISTMLCINDPTTKNPSLQVLSSEKNCEK